VQNVSDTYDSSRISAITAACEHYYNLQLTVSTISLLTHYYITCIQQNLLLLQ